MLIRVCVHRHACTENFFFGQLLYTSAVAMVTQVCDPAEVRDWLERSEGEEGRGTLLEGYRGVQGRGPDTKIIRSIHYNPYEMAFYLMVFDSISLNAMSEPFPELSVASLTNLTLLSRTERRKLVVKR